MLVIIAAAFVCILLQYQDSQHNRAYNYNHDIEP
jgi:hypothetical protein